MARRHMLTYGTTRAPAGDGGRRDPHQRPRQPRGRVPRPGPVHGRRHPGLAPDRRALPPARLRHDLGGRVRPRAGAAPSGHRPWQGRSGSSAAPATATGPPTPWHRCGTSPHGRVRNRRDGWEPTRRRPPSPWPGSVPTDVDVAELYDPFSFEIIRQLEAFGFCGPGEGGPWSSRAPSDPGAASRSPPTVAPCRSAIRGSRPSSCSGSSGASSSSAATARRRRCAGAEVALCSNGGSGALFADVLVLGGSRP